MTELAERTATVPADERRDRVTQVADTLIGLVRSVNRARARMVAHAAAHDVEWSAQFVLRCIDGEGPMRAGALAACLQSDPSTVSRQVAALVKDGLLERRADPDDGRASLLVLTARARRVLADHDTVRIEHFGGLVADWSDAELERFAADLTRFTGDYDLAMTAIVDRLAGQHTESDR